MLTGQDKNKCPYLLTLGSISGVFPKKLDGNTPCSPACPSVGEGNTFYPRYEDMYRLARETYMCYTPYWNSEQWAKEYREAPKYRRYYAYPGYMDAIWDLYQEQIERENRVHAVSEAREKLRADLGPREFTLTYSPSWYETDEEAQIAMRVAIDKLTRYYKDEINEFRAVGEYTKAGRSHVHCYYLLDGGRKITDKNFKRAWKHWNPRKKMGDGHQGGHHATIRKFSDFAGYVEKDLKDAWMNIHIKNASQDKNSRSSPCSQESSGGADGSTQEC